MRRIPIVALAIPAAVTLAGGTAPVTLAEGIGSAQEREIEQVQARLEQRGQ